MFKLGVKIRGSGKEKNFRFPILICLTLRDHPPTGKSLGFSIQSCNMNTLRKTQVHLRNPGCYGIIQQIYFPQRRGCLEGWGKPAWLKVQLPHSVSHAAVRLGHWEQGNQPHDDRGTQPYENVAKSLRQFNSQFQCYKYLKPTLGEGKIKCLLLKLEL